MKKLFLSLAAAFMAAGAMAQESADPVLQEVNTVANAIACYDAGVVKTNDSVAVQGIISKMQLKATNFAKYGSVCIWVVDEEGSEQNLEFYNCYSLDGDTLAYFGPGYVESGTKWLDVDTVVDRLGRMIVMGDKVTAIGTITKYNSQYELNTGCYLIDGVRIPVDDIEISPAEGDITAALAAAIEGKNVGNITINLTAGVTYTVSGSIVAPAGLTINGNGATIDASVLEAALITTPAGDLSEWATAELTIKDVTLKGVKKGVYASAGKNYLYKNFTVENSVIEIAATTGLEFDFRKGGVAENFSISNSTIYAPEATTNSLYTSQSGQKATEAGIALQSFYIYNSTLYNLAKSKNFFTHRQSNQTWLAYNIQNSLFLNVGKSGQVVKGANGGQGGPNPTWNISGNAFNFDGADTSAAEDTGDAEEPVQNSVAGVIEFANAAEGDFNGIFTLAEGAAKPTSLGDPRWNIKFPMPPITEARSWDFTKGADYASVITISDDMWTDPAAAKGRAYYVPVLNGEEIMASADVKLGLTEGLYFTAGSKSFLIGFTGNYFLQMGGTVIINVPQCNANDTIVVDYCSSTKNTDATISSNNIIEGVTTQNTSKTQFSMIVKEADDVALVFNNRSRIYTLAVKPYVAPVAGECKPATVEQAGVDVANKAWKYVVTEGQEGETLSVVIGEAEAVQIESGATIIVKPGVAVTITATIGEDKGVSEFTAPEFNFTETVEKPAVKSVDLVGISYTIPALDNAGVGNGYAVKYRTNQTIDGNANAFVINVTEGLVITGVTIKGKNNFSDGDITVVTASVDGGASLLDGEYIMFNAAQEEQVATFSGVAKQQIVISFGTIQGSANQYNADVTVTWAFADEVAEVENKFELQTAVKVEPTGIESVAAAAQKDGKFFKNGQIFIVRGGRTFNSNGQVVK